MKGLGNEQFPKGMGNGLDEYWALPSSFSPQKKKYRWIPFRCQFEQNSMCDVLQHQNSQNREHKHILIIVIVKARY